ncbi:mannan-binding lectin serine protease 1-like [Crassostrea angulata]|uniref:mannan-binding lectin serine protease 1-like n=1 Tax=Magallana angulata TaxID=2784310 RepID=UPI0022B11201|nr:mannan-binding lectin serine protease 1-like [Crassostrea angulata]
MDVLIYFSFMTAVVAGNQHTNQTDIDASRNGSTGIITSPGYPGNYPNNVAYTWTLKTGNLNATVSFNFQDFDIIKYRYTPHCQDYLQIYETEPCCFKAMHRCDKYKPVSLTVRGSVITITFESDNLHNSKGFHLTWTVYIPRTPAVSTTSLWTSKIQTKSSAKISYTTGPKILGTTDPEIPISKTENIIGTSLNIPKTPAMSKASLWTSKIQTITSINITFTTRHKKLDTTDSGTPTTKSGKVKYTRPKMASHKQNTYTTDTARKTSTLKQTKLTTQQQNSTTVYLVAGIGVVELTLVALAIYIVKQRRSNMSGGQNAKDKIHPVSRKSVVSVGNVYESIPLEHFSIKDAIPEEDEDVYTEVSEHVYDKTFEHRPHVNVNPNLYQLLSELKTKNR